MIDSGFIVLLAGVGAVGVGLWYLVLLLWAEYRLGRHEVEVLLFDRVVRRVPLNHIDDVLLGARFPAEVWPSPHSTRGRWLSIRKKRGFFRYLVISPRNPNGLRRDIYFALGWNPDAS